MAGGLGAGGWRLGAGGWRLVAGGGWFGSGGWELAACGWRLMAWGYGSGGWRLLAVWSWMHTWLVALGWPLAVGSVPVNGQACQSNTIQQESNGVGLCWIGNPTQSNAVGLR